MGKQPPQPVIDAARASQAKWKIPASVSLAQWALESSWGAKDMGCFNYFGMKARCDARGTPLDPHVMMPTREVSKSGQDYTITAPFRKFASADEAFDEHGKLLATAGAYAKARAALPDADKFADALTGVYATDPKYGQTLRQIMRGSDLYRFNRSA
jgi:flagellum-specific peptidoglycan hydrolase FlgJ